MAGLKFLITGDDSPIRKTLEKLKKDTANASAGVMKSSIAVAEESKRKQKEVLDTINKQTEAVRRRNNEEGKRKPILSNSQAEVNAYQKGKTGNAITGSLTNTRSQQDLINQFKELDVLQMKITADYQAGRIAADTYAKHIDTLSKKQAELRTAIQDYDKAQNSATSSTTKANAPVKIQEGLLKRLNAQLKTYKEQKLGIPETDIDSIAKANGKIEQLENELARLNRIGRTGFDDLGNAINRPIGKLDRLKYAAAEYQKMATTATNPAIIEKYNRKLQETQIEIGRVSNVGKKGFDELGNKIKSSGNLLDRLWGGLKNVAYLLPGLGIAGLLGLFIDPIANAISKLDIFKKKISETEKAQRTLNAAFASSEYTGAVKQISELTTNVDLAKKGLIDKQDVVKQYNESIGKTTGEVRNLNEVETFLVNNADAYIQMTLNKAAAQLALEEAAKKAYEAEQARAKGEQPLSLAVGSKGQGLENLTFWDRVKDAFVADDGYTRKLVDQRTKIIVDGAEKAATEQENIAKSFQQKAAEIAKRNKFNLFGIDSKAVTTENQYQSALFRRQGVLDSLNKLQSDYSRKSLSQEDEAKQAIVDRFAEMRNQLVAYNTWAAQYNRTHKGKEVGLIGLGQLEPLKQSAINDLTERQAIERAKLSISQQAQLYSDFEAAKAEMGAEEAKKRYSVEYDTYLAFLTKQREEVAKMPQSADYLKEIDKQIEDEKSVQKRKYMDLLAEYQDFEQGRVTLMNKYVKLAEDFRKKGDEAAAKEVIDRGYEELKAYEEQNLRRIEAYKFMFSEIEHLSELELRNSLQIAKKKAEADHAAGKITIETYRSILKLIKETEQAVDGRLSRKLSDIANAFNEISQAVGNTDFGSFLSGLGNIIGQVGKVNELANAFKNATTDQEKFSAKAGLVAAGINGVIGLVNIFTSSAKARRQAEEEYYSSAIKSQNEYNLSLNEEMRLRSQLAENVFVQNYKGRIQDGTAALTDANKKYLTSLQELQKGQAKIGKRNAVDPNNLLGGAASGAALGAAVGSFIPVVGTVVGGIIGGIGGAIAGLFGGKKKKDVFGGLLQEYPELIQQATDGTLKFNDALAKNLIDNNLVNDATNAMLQNTIELAEARKKALEQINSVIADLAGNLGNDLRSSLVDAFKAGEDSAISFGNTVSGVLENIISQFLFQEVFGEQFDALQAEMKKSFDLGGDQSFVDDIAKFYETAGPLIGNFNEGLRAAQEEAKKIGLDVFKGITEETSKSGLKGSIQRDLTEQTGSELTGLYRATYDLQKNQYNTLLEQRILMGQKLAVLNAIAVNTGATAENTARLAAIETTLATIATNTKPSQTARDLGI